MKAQIKHFFKALNILGTVKKQRAYLSLVKNRDYNEVMKVVDLQEWARQNSYTK